MDLEKNLADYVNSFGKLVDEIESSLKIQNCFSRDKHSSLLLYVNLSDNIHKLKVLTTQIQVILEDEKKKLNQFKDKLSKLKLLDKRINLMMVFSLQHSPSTDVEESNSSLSSVEKDSQNKENLPVRIKTTEKKKLSVPSINFLSAAALESVPKYIKGRTTLQQVNNGIADINLVLSKKYQLLGRPHKALTLKEQRLRGVYAEQARDLKGTCYSTFFVDDDIQKYSTCLKAQKKSRDNIFHILRHLGKMKEVHRGTLKRYCILTA